MDENLFSSQNRLNYRSYLPTVVSGVVAVLVSLAVCIPTSLVVALLVEILWNPSR